MLDNNNELNEYDFVLFDLYKTNQKYREYFLNQRKEHPERLMIFDNSAYEFFVKGESLDVGEFYQQCGYPDWRNSSSRKKKSFSKIAKYLSDAFIEVLKKELKID